jgi:hypothetical protein
VNYYLVTTVGECTLYLLIKACHNVAPPSFATGEGEQRELRSPVSTFTSPQDNKLFSYEPFPPMRSCAYAQLPRKTPRLLRHTKSLDC